MLNSCISKKCNRASSWVAVCATVSKNGHSNCPGTLESIVMDDAAAQLNCRQVSMMSPWCEQVLGDHTAQPYLKGLIGLLPTLSVALCK